jgi:hypothetical protein
MSFRCKQIQVVVTHLSLVRPRSLARGFVAVGDDLEVKLGQPRGGNLS